MASEKLGNTKVSYAGGNDFIPNYDTYNQLTDAALVQAIISELGFDAKIAHFSKMLPYLPSTTGGFGKLVKEVLNSYEGLAKRVKTEVTSLKRELETTLPLAQANAGIKQIVSAQMKARESVVMSTFPPIEEFDQAFFKTFPGGR